MADARKPHHKVRSFVAGSVLGGLVVLVAPHARKRRRQLSMPRGLAAFEGAPCTDARPDGTLPDARAAAAAPPAPAAQPPAPRATTASEAPPAPPPPAPAPPQG
jgi:hypothetical protein